MHSFSLLTTHESRNLKQARPNGQYVDLLRNTLATPPWENTHEVYHLIVNMSITLSASSQYLRTAGKLSGI